MVNICLEGMVFFLKEWKLKSEYMFEFELKTMRSHLMYASSVLLAFCVSLPNIWSLLIQREIDNDNQWLSTVVVLDL